MSRPFSGGRRPRPGYEADRRRRREFVRTQLRQHGEREGAGWRAQCQVCGHVRVLPISRWWADHVTPVALGGSEDGPLRLSCAECQIKQGSKVANAVNPKAVPRRRPKEDHPGFIR